MAGQDIATPTRPAAPETERLRQGIVEWVEMETPSERPDLIDRLLDKVEADFEGLPVTRERLPARDGHGGMLILRYAPEGASGAPVVMMGHVDTVWAVGTLAARPVRQEGDRLYGPGIFDMKAGSYLATETLRQLAAEGAALPRPVTMFLNGDEETGSAASRETIEAICADAAFVMVPEPSFEAPGTVITARKGRADFRLVAHGVSAHAGGSREQGASAVRELAHHTLEIEALNETEPRASFNVGTFRGGTHSNVVPPEASIEVDMRAVDMETADRLIAATLARTAKYPGVRLEVTGGLNRAPFERSPQVAKLYGAVVDLAARLGQPMAETARGGCSDGNFPAAMGKPVLDGLGCSGRGAHAIDEHILVSTIAPRAELMRAMLTDAAFQAAASQ
ncbi:M20 family metallopeptidase [Salipiger mucosus]|uniref:Peptidase M20 n=1 Tax=Salipiger mucosus DSM 16094 TaxID=1123237 RepID=S9RQL7_9RHOB|nr:M20 family metallopeptidase [Salipiger mucosus]EPX80355.1 peptidase M20 [Salipiger mucosus DSM 16094]